MPEVDPAPDRAILALEVIRIMKVLLTAVSISLALPVFTPAFAQAARGGAGAGAAGSATARSAGASTVSPTGNLSGRAGFAAGPALSAPAGGNIATPGTATPVGPNSGISATPPAVNGRTFDRATIGGGPTDTIVDPNARQPVFRFPPASTLPQGAVTNTGVGNPGFPDATTFPPGNPVRVGNTVGANFGAVLTNTAPREAVAVDLPPGARLTTNRFGVTIAGVPTAPEAVVAPPVVVPTNSVGNFRGIQTGTDRIVAPRQVPQRSAPPRNPSVVRP